jgi:putative membrane protein
MDILKARDIQMKLAIPTICCVALFSIPALAQKAPAMSDQQFLDFAAQTDMVEAHIGQLAQSEASSQAVKDYAQMLVTDHTNDYLALHGLAAKDNLNLPGAIDAAHNKAMIAPYHQLKGAGFDHRYVEDMIAGHTKAIAIYKQEAADAQDPEVKAYAQETLPTLEKHLDGAKALEKQKPGA